jgi:hypothetical protein
MDVYTRAVSGQRLGKHIPIARHQILNNEKLYCNNGRCVFSTWSVARCYKQGTRLELSQFCTGVCEERTWREAEESPLLKSVTRKRLVKTLQT